MYSSDMVSVQSTSNFHSRGFIYITNYMKNYDLKDNSELWNDLHLQAPPICTIKTVAKTEGER